MKNFVFALILVMSAEAHSVQDRFIPEASGAEIVNGTVIIAGDEEPNALWRLNNMVPEKMKVAGPRWDDMEALASLDQDGLFFAITSHSLTKKRNRREEREQLFLMKYDGKVTVQKRWSLRDHILSFLDHEVRGLSPIEGGLNIEGMTWVKGKLYLGLRSPLAKNGDAIILEMKNAMTNPEVARIHTLPLGGRGVRGLETKGNQIAVLSGSIDDTDKEFGLDTYYPDSGIVYPLNVTGFHHLKRPESLVYTDGAFLFFQDFETPQSQDVVIRLGY